MTDATPATTGHLAHCASHAGHGCTCGASSTRTEAEARLARFVNLLRRASTCVYIAMDKCVADDLSPMLKTAADKIETQATFLSTVADYPLNGESGGRAWPVQEIVMEARALRDKIGVHERETARTAKDGAA